MTKEYLVLMSNDRNYHIWHEADSQNSFIKNVNSKDGLIKVNEILMGEIYINTKQIIYIQEILTNPNWQTQILSASIRPKLPLSNPISGILFFGTWL